MSIKLYIVDADENDVRRLEGYYFDKQELNVDVIGTASTTKQAIENFDLMRKADVFLVAASLPDKSGVLLIRNIKQINPDAKVIIKVDKNSSNALSSAYREGAEDTISHPYEIEELNMKVTGLMSENNSDNEQDDKLDIFSTSSAVEENYRDDEYTSSTMSGDRNIRVEKPNSVVVIVSPASNGKTTLAVNLASKLKSMYAKTNKEPKICLIDFNLIYPSLMMKFNDEHFIKCKRDIYEVLEDMEYLQEAEEYLKEAIKIHKPTGIHVLNTPIDVTGIHKMHLVSPNVIEQLIYHLREMYDVVIIDTSQEVMNDTTIVPMTVADHILVLTQPEFTNVMSVWKMLRIIDEVEKKAPEKLMPKMSFILNMESNKSSKATMNVDMVKELLERKIDFRIPYDENFTHSSNTAKLYVNEHPNSLATRTVEQIANRIYNIKGRVEKNEEEKKSVLDSIIRRFKK